MSDDALGFLRLIQARPARKEVVPTQTSDALELLRKLRRRSVKVRERANNHLHMAIKKLADYSHHVHGSMCKCNDLYYHRLGEELVTSANALMVIAAGGTSKGDQPVDGKPTTREVLTAVREVLDDVESRIEG